jgi:predicted RecA/RadA family phage recombinase
MRNYVQAGDVIAAIAPYALASGQGVLVGSMFGVAAYDAANGALANIKRKGVFDITALTADTGTVGAKVYWDDTARRLTVTAAGNTLVGCLALAKAGTDATARVLLDGAIR